MNIPIPNLPTDSLYKFGVAGCIIMIIAQFYFMDSMVGKLSETPNQQVDQTEVRLENKIDRFYQTSLQLRSIMANDDLGEYQDEALEDLAQNLNAQNDEIKNAFTYLKDLRKSDAEHRLVGLEYTKERFKSFSWQIQIWNFLYLIFIILWFIRTQLPNDKLLKLEIDIASEKLRRERLELKAMENDLGQH